MKQKLLNITIQILMICGIAPLTGCIHFDVGGKDEVAYHNGSGDHERHRKWGISTPFEGMFEWHPECAPGYHSEFFQAPVMPPPRPAPVQPPPASRPSVQPLNDFGPGFEPDNVVPPQQVIVNQPVTYCAPQPSWFNGYSSAG